MNEQDINRKLMKAAWAEAYLCFWMRRQANEPTKVGKARMDRYLDEWRDELRLAIVSLADGDSTLADDIEAGTIVAIHAAAAELHDGPIGEILGIIGLEEKLTPRLRRHLGLKPGEWQVKPHGNIVALDESDESFLAALSSDEPRWVDPPDGYGR